MQGVYQVQSDQVNGKPYWVSTSQAIWYIPEFKKWGIGPKCFIGTRTRGISSRFENEFDLPYDINDWDYYKGRNGWSKGNGNEISVKCQGQGKILKTLFS